MNEEVLIEKIKYLTSMPHSSLVEHCIYLENENDNYKAQKYITDFIIENGIICEKNKKIEQLQSNWNSLREYIGKEWYCFDNESVEYEVAKNILDKMNKLEGGKNNEKI